MNKLTIALAGNPNVGKSVIFNQLTGERQHVGNWPGKTVEKFEGRLNFLGKDIKIVDLPGTYSLSAFSQEEEIAKDFVKKGKPDVVIDIVDAASLEQSLFLTLQLLELGANVVIALNMIDIAKEKGREIDAKKLARLLGVPVVPTIATQGKGIQQLVIESINAVRRGKKAKKIFPKNISKRYEYIHDIVEKCQKETTVGPTLTERLDGILLHRYFGYAFLALILLSMFFLIFGLGNTTSTYITQLINYFKQIIPSQISSNALFLFFWRTVIDGIIAGITIAIPYLLPFYIFLSVLEASGYLPRIAFLTDSLMHRIGLHGKAFIPLFLGYGCSVPACIGCRIMESDDQRFLTAFLATMIPCAARSVIILGLVGLFLGFWWAVGIYTFNILVVFILGFILSRFIITKPVGLIMNMPSYQMPDIFAILRRTFLQIKHFIVIAFPIIILSTFVINTLDFFGLLKHLSEFLSPITVGLLGLPAIVGIALVVGFLRKELAIVLLAALFGTENLAGVLTPLQMVVFTIVSIFYIPCAATIATLVKEFGWRKAAFITVFEIVFAIALGTAARVALSAFI
ncbi:MAG: ferrous iron transporter B [Candidatus Bilamarchaeaceae archaeon]